MRSHGSWMKAAMALLSIVAAIASAEMAYACTTPPPTPPPPPQITHVEGSLFSVRITGYFTFGAEQGQVCGCGLAVGGDIAGVTGAQLVVAGTNTPVEGFGTFQSNPNTTDALQKSATPPAGTQWSGFSAQIVNPGVQPEQPADVLFTVRAASGMGIAQVAKSLKTNLIGTGEVSQDGSQFIHHFAAVSTQVVTVPILAEASPVQSGFYECKVEGKTRKASEDTLLMLVNQSSTEKLCATVVLMDSHEKVVACGGTILSPDDLDEINLCQMLPPPTPALATPLAGVVEVVTTSLDSALGLTCPPDPAKLTPDSFEGGVYSWIKDVVFKGRKTILADPSTASTIIGIGKTQMRLAPPEVSDPSIVFNKCWELQSPPALLPSRVYAEDTFE